jgi:NCS1 family nucleobase:cation symporter-1
MATEEKRAGKAKILLRKLAVTSEPGLTNAQLMLTNHDLKPGVDTLH